MSRLDARAKASGATRYVADLTVPGMLYASIVRSDLAHGRLLGIDASAALGCEGVVGVYTAADVTPNTYGRSVKDAPILARDKVRFMGERVAAVVATTRAVAERAAGLVEVDYLPLPLIASIDDALASDAALIHDAPWEYPSAHVGPDAEANVQGVFSVGDRSAAEEALAASRFVVDEIYATPSVHHGYLEPQACLAALQPDGHFKLWCTNKSPYALRGQLAACLDLDPALIEIEPITLGGDFGGKGSIGDMPLCLELTRLTGRPVKIVLRYNEELTATATRHPTRVRMRIGCDELGHLESVVSEALVDGGAYAGFAPNARGTLTGLIEDPGYLIPNYYADTKLIYTNKVPKTNMRAPGSPQFVFAFESALDELAETVGISPADLRRRNLLRAGQHRPLGHGWAEYRGLETLDAALGGAVLSPAPKGWLLGQGIAMHDRHIAEVTRTSLRLIPREDGGLRVEIPTVETGTGSHTVMRELIAKRLGLAIDQVEVAKVATQDLPQDPGAGGSQVTVRMAKAVDAAINAWQARTDNEPLVVAVDTAPSKEMVGCYGVQVAQVAVDTTTGQVKVLEILTAVDVAEILNEKAHQMQIDGGTVMGFGFACLEDLDEKEGQVWAANLGEFKIPSTRDVPTLRTVLVRGGRGVGEANVKNIGELTTPPTAAAVANAVHAAIGCRIRELPITAERVLAALAERGGPNDG